MTCWQRILGPDLNLVVSSFFQCLQKNRFLFKILNLKGFDTPLPYSKCNVIYDVESCVKAEDR